MKLLRHRKLGLMKEIPRRSVDDLVGGKTKNVNNRIGRVQDTRFRREI